MKRFFGIFFAVFLIFSLCIPASAAEQGENVEIDVPENFTVINSSNAAEHKEFLESINFTVKNFKVFLTDNSILLYATNKSGGELTIKKYASEFSKTIDDLYFMEDSDIRKVFDKYFADISYSTVKVEKSKNAFVKFEYDNSDKGGEFYGVQLLTVKNGEIYSINFTDSDKNKLDDSTVNLLITSFNYKGKTSLEAVKPDTVITVIILGVAVIAFFCIAVYIIITFVTDIKERRDQNDVAPYVKIKRRKF